MISPEGRHYGKREKKSEKQFYSLREIVVEITGIDEDSDLFDAKYKEIQRIVGVFRKLLGQKGSKMRIHSSEKNAVVEATKSFYMNEDARKIIKKLDKEETLTIEEHDFLIDIFVEAKLKYSTEDEEKKVKQFIVEAKQDEFFDKGAKIKKEVIDDIFLVDKIEDYETKLEYLNEYKKILDDSLETCRNNIKIHIEYDKAYERVVKKHTEYLRDQSLTDKNIASEVLTSMLNKIALMELEKQK